MHHSFRSLLLLISLLCFSGPMLVAQTPATVDPFGAPAADPFAPAPAGDPFAPAPAFAADPFAQTPDQPAVDPINNDANDFFKPVPDQFKFIYNDPFASEPEPHREFATRGIFSIAFYSADIAAPPRYVQGSKKLLIQMSQTALRQLYVAQPGLKLQGFEVVDDDLPAQKLAKLSPAERLTLQLERPVKVNLNQSKLEEISLELEAKFKIPIIWDKKAFNEAAFDTATPIDWGSPHPIKLRLVLKRLLADLGLTYYTDEGMLVMTTRTAAENRLIVRTYPIDPDLLKVRKRFRRQQPFYGQFGGHSGVGPYGGGGLFNVMQLGGIGTGEDLFAGTGVRPVSGFGGGSGTLHLFAEYDEIESLVSTITSIIQPTTWRENGGLGNIEPNLQLGLLVVSNSEEVQDELAALLALFNKQLAERRPSPVSPDTVERIVHPVVLPAVRLKQQNPLDHQRPISKEPAFTMDQLAEQLKKQIEPASWANPQYTITTLGQNLIVNQTHANQEKIRAFLRQLGITKEQVDDEKQFAEEQEQARKDLNLRQEQERERIEQERVKRNAAEQRQREEREAEEQRKRDEQQRKLLEEQKKREAESRQREAKATKRRSES